MCPSLSLSAHSLETESLPEPRTQGFLGLVGTQQALRISVSILFGAGVIGTLRIPSLPHGC